MLSFLSFIICSLFIIGDPDNGERETLQSSPPYIVQDSITNVLVNSYRQMNNAKKGMQGFRIHIYTDSGNGSKLRTEKEQVEFNKNFPYIRSYITYSEPNYRLRVGDFRSRLDAVRFLNNMSQIYPGAYLVVDRINFPALSSDRIEIQNSQIEIEEVEEQNGYDD